MCETVLSPRPPIYGMPMPMSMLRDWPIVEEETGSDTGELTPRDWPSVEEQAGNETDDAKSTVTSTNSSRKSTDSSDSVASGFPPLKRPRLDVFPKKYLEGYEIAKLSRDDYLAYLNFLDEEDTTEPETETDGRSEGQQCADLALAQYNQEKNVDFEFTGVRSMSPFPFPSGYKGTHLNFYARRRGSESEENELFYAELDHCENKVYNCDIVTSMENDDFMIHPEYVKCKGCEDGSYGLGDWVAGEEVDYF